MVANLSLITCADAEIVAPPISANPFFWQQSQSLGVKPAVTDVDILNSLTARAVQKPKCLLTHVQRINFCYHARLTEQLYAALIDFLIILNKRGEAISRRMVNGTVSILTAEQSETLHNYLRDVKVDKQLLSGNRYSVFSKGLIGTIELVRYTENKKQRHVDPLSLARDFIEYSQLAEAQSVLEAAILIQPDRLELHEELLGLYQSTRNVSGFKHMLDDLIVAGVNIPDIWHQLDAYFKGWQHGE
ncbi:MAG: hypothetical protein ABL925_07715 [Methylococcales bacterium]